MAARELIFLGTASQVPTRARNHNGLFLRWDQLGILFDPGEGTQRQMAHAGLAATQITHIAITHFHGDHCLGLAALVQRISLDRVPHAVEVIYPESGQMYFDRLRRASIFHDQAILAPRPISGSGPLIAWRGDRVSLYAHSLEHRVDCYGYRLVEDDALRMLPDRLARAGVHGPRVGELMRSGRIEVDGRAVALEEVSAPRPGQVFALVMDTRPCPGAEWLAWGADLLVCESTYLSSEHAEAHDHYHMTAAQAGELARRARARSLALTHFSQRYQSVEPLLAEARAHHPETIAAEDLLVVPVPKRR